MYTLQILLYDVFVYLLLIIFMYTNAVYKINNICKYNLLKPYFFFLSEITLCYLIKSYLANKTNNTIYECHIFGKKLKIIIT